MDADRFEMIIRSLPGGSSRRGVGLALVGLSLGGALGSRFGLDGVDARKKHKKKKKPCKSGTKRCGKKCIPTNTCCNNASCGNGGACVDGACLCLNGFKPCQGACVPNGACCFDTECPAGSGQTCQNGFCACPAGQQNSGGLCATPPTCAGRYASCVTAGDCCGGLCGNVSKTCATSGPGEGCYSDGDCGGSGTTTCFGFVCI